MLLRFLYFIMRGKESEYGALIGSFFMFLSLLFLWGALNFFFLCPIT
jgi:hypothetical protein